MERVRQTLSDPLLSLAVEEAVARRDIADRFRQNLRSMLVPADVSIARTGKGASVGRPPS